MAEIPGADATASAYRCMYTDKLGSVRVVRDQNKLQKASYDYDPYGGQYQFSGLPVNHGFTGHTWDAETALYYAPYRYYSPAATRWLTRDPLGMVDGLNVYGYVGENPVTRIDRTGLSALPRDGWWNPAYWAGLALCLGVAGGYSELEVYITGVNRKGSGAHCLMGCRLQKCMGSNNDMYDMAGRINDIYEWFGAGGYDSARDTQAAKDGAACGKQCDSSCHECCEKSGW